MYTYVKTSDTTLIFGVCYKAVVAENYEKLGVDKQCKDCDLCNNVKACDMVECRKEYREDTNNVIFKTV